jgi:GTP 3',8-cyclase
VLEIAPVTRPVPKDEGEAMFDRFNRDINYLRISVTDRCNLRCLYCLPKEGVSQIGHDDILRYEEIVRIVSVASRIGIAKVRITGGEPLVRKGITAFVASLQALGVIDDISITTNGILLAEFAFPLFAAGMRRINISLDSLEAEKYTRITRGGDLQAVLRGIEAARAAGFSPIKINTVAIRGFNEEEVTAFARLTLETPYQVRFIELMPMGAASFSDTGTYLSNELVREAIAAAFPLEPMLAERNREDGPARLYKIAGAQGEIGFISPLSSHFCHTCNRLRLTADGHLRACLLSDTEVDLKDPLRQGCSDDEIEGLIREAIVAKPGNHSLTLDDYAVKKCVKNMSAIGG